MSESCCRKIVVTLFAAGQWLALAQLNTVFGQDAHQQVAVANEPILADYNSWTLFLVCNQEWIQRESGDKLLDLFYQFEDYGRVIGPRHLAVWFWRESPQEIDTNLSDYVDVGVASQYCEKFGLRPSEGPYVVTTTEYPDLGTALGDRYVLALNEARSEDVTTLLEALTNQLLVEGLNQDDLDSEAYWRGWARTFDSVGSGVSAAVNRVKLVIDTKYFRAEVDLFE